MNSFLNSVWVSFSCFPVLRLYATNAPLPHGFVSTDMQVRKFSLQHDSNSEKQHRYQHHTGCYNHYFEHHRSNLDAKILLSLDFVLYSSLKIASIHHFNSIFNESLQFCIDRMFVELQNLSPHLCV